jgi:hypothetical protein
MESAWHSHDPYPEFPAAWSFAAGRVLIACRRYMVGQHRLQVSIDRGHGFGFDITAPEF